MVQLTALCRGSSLTFLLMFRGHRAGGFRLTFSYCFVSCLEHDPPNSLWRLLRISMPVFQILVSWQCRVFALLYSAYRICAAAVFGILASRDSGDMSVLSCTSLVCFLLCLSDFQSHGVARTISLIDEFMRKRKHELCVCVSGKSLLKMCLVLLHKRGSL